ncbi:hypothetical protein I3760_07G052600 [Carya illinoinensis]|nr:hypothetical protein I3760_07G052600 [Carya illinoinensis]
MEFTKESSLLHKLQEQQKYEEILWRQKSRISWLTTTDLNTKFYHLSITIRRRRNGIDSIKLSPGIWTMDQEVIELNFIDYFKSIYTSMEQNFLANLENLFENHISRNENEFLTTLSLETEIHGALKQIPNHKALGPDRMTALFY